MIVKKSFIINERILFLNSLIIWFLILLYFSLGRIITPKKEVIAIGDYGYTLTPIKSEFADLNIDLTPTQPVKETTSYVIQSSTSIMDARVVALQRFLKSKGSPLAPHAELIVQLADKYKMDWRILVSISGVESAFCTITPYKTYNCWGWRGGPGGQYSKFKNWEDAIRYISKRLAKGYGPDIDPYAIESTYCPPCGATGQHYWARGVVMYMNQLDKYLKK